jgi:hypothetical protein
MRSDPLAPFGGVSLAEIRASLEHHRMFNSAKQREAESHIDEIWAAVERDKAIRDRAFRMKRKGA